MNKKLIALAIAAAIAPAAAMADSGNVTVYGIMDASVDVTDNGNGTVVAGVAPSVNGIRTTKVSSNNSRLGFKGNEDLGNGLSAVWQIESTIGADGTTYTTNSRNTFVGLSSKTAGTGILGRHDTPYKISTRAYDLFQDGLADTRNLMGQGSASFDGRQSNVMAYLSPTMSGFNAAV
ncbi:MAG: porin, partial [Sulfuricella sp.]|nr:porin [Sulfuricella sp.]